MPIQFICPSCGRELSAPDEAAGVTGPCPYCKAQITAPAGSGQRAELVAPPPDGTTPTAQEDNGTAAQGQPTATGTPSGAVPPPAPVGGGYYEEIPTPSGTLDVGAIVSESWRTVLRYPGPIIGSFLIVMLISLAIGAISGGFRPPEERSAAASLLGLVLNIAAIPLYLGPYFVIDSIMTRGDAEIGLLFRGYQNFGNIVAATLLFYLAVLAGLLALIVGAIYVGVALSLTFMELVDRGTPAVDALRASWDATQGRRLSIFGVTLILGIIAGLGFLVCGVGALITVPMYYVGQVIIYRELRGLRGEMLP